MRKASSAKVEPCHPELCANMPKIDNRYIDVENNSTADIDNLYKSKDLTKSQTKATRKTEFRCKFHFQARVGSSINLNVCCMNKFVEMENVLCYVA